MVYMSGRNSTSGEFPGQMKPPQHAEMTPKKPQTRSEIEDFFRAKLSADEAETGLYDIGSGAYLVVDRVGPDNEITFQWFDVAMGLNDLLYSAQ